MPWDFVSWAVLGAIQIHVLDFYQPCAPFAIPLEGVGRGGVCWSILLNTGTVVFCNRTPEIRLNHHLVTNNLNF